jgi:hypothetical protein
LVWLPPPREEAVILEEAADTREAAGILAAVAHILRHLMAEEVVHTLPLAPRLTSALMPRPTLVEEVALISLRACHTARPTPGPLPILQFTVRPDWQRTMI